MLSDGLTEAVSVALEAARWTGGLVDPTVGDALIALGYDRDFAAIDPDRNEPPDPPQPAPGWPRVRLNGPLLELPAGVRLDLGATAKGLGSDRSARAAWLAGAPGRRGAGQSGRRHRGGRPAARRRLADPGGRQSSAARLIGAAAGPAGRWGRRDLVHHLPQVAAGRPAAAPHRGPADGPACGRTLADGQRGRADLCGRQRRGHRGHRGRRSGHGLAGHGGRSGAAGRSRRRRALRGRLARCRRRPRRGPHGQPRVRRIEIEGSSR